MLRVLKKRLPWSPLSLYGRTRSWAASERHRSPGASGATGCSSSSVGSAPTSRSSTSVRGRAGRSTVQPTNPIVALDLNPRASEWLAAPNVRVESATARSSSSEDGEFGAGVLELDDRARPPRSFRRLSAPRSAASADGTSCRRRTGTSRSSRTTSSPSSSSSRRGAARA